jgi:hypothetical protein
MFSKLISFTKVDDRGREGPFFDRIDLLVDHFLLGSTGLGTLTKERLKMTKGDERISNGHWLMVGSGVCARPTRVN